MSRKYKFNNPTATYFVSFATVYWLDVFTRQVYFSILEEAISYCRKEKGMEVFAYCFMPSHVHLVFRSDKEDPSGVFQWPWKLVREGESGEHQLYNVLEDPYEKENLAQVKPEILTRLETVLAALPNVPTRRTVNEKASSANASIKKTHNKRGWNIDYEARKQETREPWAEAAIKGNN